MDTRSTAFLTVFIAMFLSGAALIMSIPPLFHSGDPAQVWVAGSVAGLFIALAAATFVLRPNDPGTLGRNVHK